MRLNGKLHLLWQGEAAPLSLPQGGSTSGVPDRRAVRLVSNGTVYHTVYLRRLPPRDSSSSASR